MQKTFGYIRASSEVSEEDQKTVLLNYGVEENMLFNDLTMIKENARKGDFVVISTLSRLGVSLGSIVLAAKRFHRQEVNLVVVDDQDFSIEKLVELANIHSLLTAEKYKLRPRPEREAGPAKKKGRKPTISGDLADNVVKSLLDGKKPKEVATLYNLQKATLYTAIRTTLASRLVDADNNPIRVVREKKRKIGSVNASSAATADGQPALM